MSERSEQIIVTDRMGFIHRVLIKHTAHFGFSTAYDDHGEIIAQREYGRIREPMTDDDLEWERYEDLFGEWSDAAKADLNSECKIHFDKNLTQSL